MRPLFEWRHQYDLDAEDTSGIRCLDESKTVQSAREDADLNVILARFGLINGPMPVAPQDPRYYGDFSEVPDLRTALDIVRDAEEKFHALPANIRERFYNSPGLLWEFVNDPRNWEECVKLGLLVQQPPVEPVVPAPPEAGGSA